MPVLIDFGGVKQVEVTKVYQLGKLRLEERLRPEEQWRQGQVFPNSDLYALAVTALVLLTGKEPEELYDSYKGIWLQREISVSSQLETVLQKMLVSKSAIATNPLRKCSKPCSPTPLHRQTPTSPRDTINFVGQNLNLMLATAPKRRHSSHCDTTPHLGCFALGRGLPVQA